MSKCQCSQVFLGRYRQFLKNLSPISPLANIARSRQIRHKPAQFRHKIATFFTQKAPILSKFDQFSRKNLQFHGNFPISRSFSTLATKLFKFRWRCGRNSIAKLGLNFADLAINRQTWEHCSG